MGEQKRCEKCDKPIDGDANVCQACRKEEMDRREYDPTHLERLRNPAFRIMEQQHMRDSYDKIQNDIRNNPC